MSDPSHDFVWKYIPKENETALFAGAPNVHVFSWLTQKALFQHPRLQLGGSAVDAALTTSLTQVATQLGSVVSYAGVLTALYYEAKTGRVYELDAGYNSYLHETDPESIPKCDFALSMLGNKGGEESGENSEEARGRKTLVPGFMAGVEALHQRFGRLPFADLFQPAIYYAERGVKISPALHGFFTTRAKYLQRTPEGRQFMHQTSGNDSNNCEESSIPKVGDLFLQPDLAKTLKAVSEQGSRYM
jgi:gamma-glutamyltranspeptidase / glutathione hydrolase